MAKSKEQHFVYILESKDGKYYTGYTNNLERRMKAHKEGKGAKFTKAFGFKKLLAHEIYPTKSEALKREISIKKLNRIQKKYLIKSLKNTPKRKKQGIPP